MFHLHVQDHETAATIPRVAARQKPILPDVPPKVDTVRDPGYSVCFVCSDSYDVEPDAFGEGCMTYFYPIRIRQLFGEETDHDA